MTVLTTKPQKTTLFVSFFQLVLLFSYLSMNIQNVGEMGIALPLLAGFIAIAGLLIFNQLVRFTLAIRLHLFVFFLFIGWFALRVIVDLGDIERLKAITIATTGGVLLFFMLGSFSRQAIDKLTQANLNMFYPKLLLLLFFLASLAIFISFKTRLVRIDIFYIEGVQGGYQRPGNFLIMLFIMASFIYLALAAHPLTKGFIRFAVWLGIYTLSLVLALISSQMIGSNAATANLLAIYMMTSVISLLALNRVIRNRFRQGRLALPLSKFFLKKLFVYSSAILFAVFCLFIIAIQITGFDLSKTRAFGFGSGTNNSVNSRFDILFETGLTQLGYAPYLGNINVAKLTGSEVGEYLHSFFPNVMAELGLVGLILVLLLLYLCFFMLLVNMKKVPFNNNGFKDFIISFWLAFVLLWLVLYANISVEKSWPVMWFYLGFAVSVFVFDESKRKIKSNISNKIAVHD